MDIKLLPHQYEVLADTQTKIIGLVGGYGNGKTYTACRKAIQLSMLNLGEVGIITEPTFPMLRDIFVPEMKIALEEWKIEYKFNASSYTFILYINGSESKIICMSAENYDRIVGINAAWAIMDEFDTSKMEIALKAYQKILGRLRAGTTRQLIITTTPEGFKATYHLFVEENTDGKKRLIKAKTSDNKYLPPDFVETLKEQYPPALLDAYLNGDFVNMASGTVFSYFNRDTYHSDEVMNEYEELIAGQDFNISGCVTIIIVRRDDTYVAVEEHVSYDTQAVIETIKGNYPTRYVAVYPDASGNNRKTNASETDIAMIRNAGLDVYVNSSNPSVKDRINITNNLFAKGKLFVNTKRCPKLTKALEQLSYDEAGEPEKSNTPASPDDFCDGFTYPLAYLEPITVPMSRTKIIGL